MEAPARLMIQSCSGTAPIQGPSWVGSPVRKLMPGWSGAGGWALRVRMVMVWPCLGQFPGQIGAHETRTAGHKDFHDNCPRFLGGRGSGSGP